MARRWRYLFTLALAALFCAPPAWADDAGLLGIERRREQFPTEFGYFIYPISGSVPGIGTAYGAGATVTNIAGSDTDFTGFYVRGDFEATGAALLNYHLLQERVIFDLAYYDAKVAPQQYSRGIHSSPDDYILPDVSDQLVVAQLTGTFYERMIEVYLRYGTGAFQLNNVKDKNGVPFENVDTGKKDFQAVNLGFALDITDDRQDPRRGVRYEAKMTRGFSAREDASTYDVMDYNLTGYYPVGQASALVVNGFFSTAVMRNRATVDRAELEAKAGLQCEGIPDPAAREQCLATERRFIDEKIAENTYGRATALGGTQRLRSFPNGRYYAGKSFSTGAEYRWNITEEQTLMDWIFFRGLRTNIQLAFFAETGSVADDVGDLTKTLRSSYGAGLRVLFSGVTIRLDWATGDEGDEVQLFLDYPWSMFSIDNPL
ncbi:MAG: BamA/TamA family outer membrane protein [Nitrospinae bacterium]|nr:BamA/TamA family outer membrane protein [Nitrospinota bacterium]